MKPLPAEISEAEMHEIAAVRARSPSLSRIPWQEILDTPHLLIPLRRAVAARIEARKEARRRAPENFELTP